jgi:hypothetical protein
VVVLVLVLVLVLDFVVSRARNFQRIQQLRTFRSLGPLNHPADLDTLEAVG